MTDKEIIARLAEENINLRDSVNYWSDRCLKAEKHLIPAVPQTMDETIKVLEGVGK